MLARRNQVWLVRGVFYKAAAAWWDFHFGMKRGDMVSDGGWHRERRPDTGADRTGQRTCAVRGGFVDRALCAACWNPWWPTPKSSTGSRPNIFIDVSQVSKLDTFGAWLIERLRRSLTQGGAEAKIAGLSANYSSLVDEVRRVKAAPASDPRR